MLTVNNANVARFARAVVDAKAKRDQAEADYRKALDTLITVMGEVPGTYNINGIIVNLAENNTYDASEMEAALKPGQVQRCSKRVLDKAVVKRLYPAVYEAAKKTNGVKVTLR